VFTYENGVTVRRTAPLAVVAALVLGILSQPAHAAPAVFVHPGVDVSKSQLDFARTEVLADERLPTLAARIELIFFDGEEAYESFTDSDGLYGSRFFAKKARRASRAQYYDGGIVWDMMGDRDLTITLPLDSPAKLASGIFAAADALQVRNHFTYYSNEIIDDHSPFNAVGIPTIDMIDFDFPPWHTAADTMDKLSAQSLQIVGAVTLYYLAEIAFK